KLAAAVLGGFAGTVRMCAWKRDRDDSDAPFRRALGQYVKPVQAALGEILKDGGDQELLACAAIAMLALEPDNTGAAEIIVIQLRVEGSEKRESAYMWIGPSRFSHPKIVAEFVARLEDPDVKLRRLAAEAVWRIGPKASKAVPALIELLKG